MSDYPECDKLHAVSEESHRIGDFIDWLRGQGVNLMVYRDDMTETVDCWKFFPLTSEKHPKDCRGGCGGTGKVERKREGWVHDPRHIEQLLADYYGIDLRKLEAEKRRVLEEIREMQP